MSCAEILSRPLMPADVSAVVDLLVQTLGQGEAPRTRDFWEWKHKANPFGESMTIVAEEADRLVGLRAFMRWNWSANSRIVAAVRAVDTATHPDFRRRGIFSRLTRELLREATRGEVSFVYNTPNRYSMPGYLKLGWRVVGRIPVLVRPRRRALRTMLGGEAAPGHLDTGVDNFPAALDIPEEILLGLAEVQPRAEGRYGTPRSVDYLKWRYQRPPGLRYHALWADDGKALVVFRERERRGFREVTVVEILGERRPAARLLRKLAAETVSDHLVAVASAHTEERRAALLAGFIPLPGVGPIATARILNQDSALPDPLDLRSWRLSLGDIELF